MTVPNEIDGSRLGSLLPRELELLLDMRVAEYHRHLTEYKMDCSANNFTYIKPIIEVLNAMQNFDMVYHDGTVKPNAVKTLFMCPLYREPA